MARMTKKEYYRRNLARDLFVIVVSVIVAIVLVRINVVQEFISFTEGLTILASFVAGLFFTSAFTLAIASVALAEIAQNAPLLTVAFFGALGAMIGDWVIFYFLRDAFSEDLKGFLKTSNYKKTLSFLHLGFMKWLAPFIGALIIASPLPDEFGLALMGASHMKTSRMLPIAFVMNFIGIIAIVSIAKAL